ncbi:CamS family sex pheromone protein [Aquibacillus albus]|uniref:Protein involved in sex pheromone biosynthesis n=1 Tax=Aquibacillus albus TaxID=1168171 RepID=A0ABS2N3Y3_9BACI|nr:CamS family sex pheromone protein [Aquibacillus albus]MBM7572804.1 protein involved in sex pheromone biosynthesis [Aquibacillus albus]
MKKTSFILLGLLLVLTSCAPSFEQRDEVVEEAPDETGEQETAIIPSYNISEENYRVMLPYKLSKARGVIVNQVANRLDIDELEEGLRRHSKEAFDPDQYYFQEGQYITQDIVYDWLERYDADQEELGLNPEIDDASVVEEQRENPKYLSHILEQNYLVKTNENVVELGGVSIGIAMKSTYRFQTEIGGPFYYESIPEDKMLEEGNEIAREVLQRVRQIDGLLDVPILIALYREAAHDSLVPGSFVAKTVVPGDRSSIDEWDRVNEEYMLFPSSAANAKYPDISANLNDFEQDISDYFPNYVSVIGEGFYINEQLRKLTIEIPITFQGKAEVVGFTQYVYGLVMEGFQTHYDLEINITSSDEQESLITRSAGEDEPVVHIYH